MTTSDTISDDPFEVLERAPIPEWTLGDRIRKARQISGLTQDELAQVLSIGKRTLLRYENDERPAKSAHLYVIALRTKVPLSWLVHGEAPATGGYRPPSGEHFGLAVAA